MGADGVVRRTHPTDSNGGVAQEKLGSAMKIVQGHIIRSDLSLHTRELLLNRTMKENKIQLITSSI